MEYLKCIEQQSVCLRVGRVVNAKRILFNGMDLKLILQPINLI